MAFEEVIPDIVAIERQFLSEEEANELFVALMNEVRWEQKEMIFGDKHVPLPRLVAWFGDPGVTYFYSGIMNESQPWTPALTALKPRLDALLPDGMTFNGVLLNYYRDGNDKIGFHSDNEDELGKNSFIASLSVGAKRRFQLKPKGKGVKKDQIVEVDLTNGTLVLMYGKCQEEWMHSVPPETELTGPRINLTLRQVIKK